MATDREIIFSHLQKQYIILIKTIRLLKFITREEELEFLDLLKDKKFKYDLNKSYKDKEKELK